MEDPIAIESSSYALPAKAGRSLRAGKARTAKRISYVRSRLNPRLALGRRNVSVVDEILNRINEIGQLLTCRIRVPLSKSIESGIQFSDQALLL